MTYTILIVLISWSAVGIYQTNKAIKKHKETKK